MLEKISSCLVHPKFMGRYIIEKTWKTVLLVVAFLLINVVTIISIAATDNTLSQQDEDMVMSTILHDKDLGLSYTDKLDGKQSSYDFTGIKLNFFSNEEATVNSPILVSFKSEGYTVYYLGFKLSEVSYQELNLKSFDMTDGISQTDRMNILHLVRSAINDFMPALGFVNGLQRVLDMLLTFMIMFLFLLLVGGAINPGVSGIFKVRLAFLSLVSYSVVYWLFLATESMFLYYMAAVVPYIYYFIAARNIIKIEG